MISKIQENITIWLIVGFIGQLCFFTRFLIQYIVSERKKKSTIPIAFWYLSITGALLVFSYAVYRRDPVFITGSVLGLFVYSRNLFFVHKARMRNE